MNYIENYIEKEFKTISDCHYLQACPRLLQASMKSAFCFRASLKDSMASCKDTNIILAVPLILFQPIQGIIQHYFFFIPFPFTSPQGVFIPCKKNGITSQRSQGCQIQTSLKALHKHVISDALYIHRYPARSAVLTCHIMEHYIVSNGTKSNCIFILLVLLCLKKNFV